MTLSKKIALVCELILILVIFGFNWELHNAKEQIQAEVNKYDILNTEYNLATENYMEELAEVNDKLTAANNTITDLKSDEYELVYVGDYKITYYCNEAYEHICGYGKRITASGKTTEVGWTAAADWSVLPNGSIIYIENIGFREVMDKGGSVKNNHIDVLVDKHQEALSIGVDNKGVWLLVKTVQN